MYVAVLMIVIIILLIRWQRKRASEAAVKRSQSRTIMAFAGALEEARESLAQPEAKPIDIIKGVIAMAPRALSFMESVHYTHDPTIDCWIYCLPIKDESKYLVITQTTGTLWVMEKSGTFMVWQPKDVLPELVIDTIKSIVSEAVIASKIVLGADEAWI